MRFVLRLASRLATAMALVCLTGMNASFAKVAFTDVLYNNYKNGWGTTSMFDLDPAVGSVKDLCGNVEAWYPGRAYDNHRGWDRDIPNDGGSYVVFAAAAGIVKTAKDGCLDGDKTCNNGAGNYAAIDHGEGITSHYFHAKPGTILVAQGEWVDRYTPLFISNNTGKSSGAHIHFEVRVNGQAVDPLGTSVSWVVKPMIDLSRCPYSPTNQTLYYLVDPYTLREYASDMIDKAAMIYAPSELGQIIKDTYWLADSDGFDPRDIVLRVYQGGSLAQSVMFAFDLADNAPRAYVLATPFAEAWMSNAMSDNILGKPITNQYEYSYGILEIDFQGGYLSYDYNQNSVPVKSYYKEGFGPGMFEDGWRKGMSYAVSEAYRNNKGRAGVGSPRKKLLSPSAAVHDWGGYFVQDFSGGFYNECAIMINALSDNEFEAHLIKGEIWETYKSLGKGPSYFGAPISDEYTDVALGLKRQDFEKGLSILGNGIVIWQNNYCSVGGETNDPANGAPCACPGEVSLIDCGKCGKQKLLCTAYVWTLQDGCQNQGECNSGQAEEKSCSKYACVGTTKRQCGAVCKWSDWSVCSIAPTAEICDNIDNDCNGETDEGLTQACGTACGSGVKTCNTGIWSECGAPKPSPETCNNIDDDCDGKTDEDLAQACSGDCGIGEQTCSAGKWDSCNAPQKNACNGCSTLAHQPGESCGANGKYACDGTDAVKCVESYTNPCGGTQQLPANPGDPCGKCGYYECGGANSVTCAGQGICTPGQSQTCSGSCGNGSQICGGDCQWGSCSAQGTGECVSGQTQSEPCGASGPYCKQGTRTRSCNTCTWGAWSECSANAYGFDAAIHCGDVICVKIVNATQFGATAKISKVGGQAFTSNPIEWFLMDTSLNKTLAFSPGFGCDAYYSGQKEITVTFDPSKYNISLDEIRAEVYSGGTTCAAQYLSGITYIQKCK